MGHTRNIVREFTHQSAAFNVSPVMSSAETLEALVDFLPLEPGSTWLEVACGPGIVSRAMAPRVARIIGTDVTPAMVAIAQREAAALGLANARFFVADATRLALANGRLDGAVTRFSLHHIPAPGRVVLEMARVVRPGGWVVLADHLTSDDADAAAWHEEIERLRDPSHWACLTPARLRRLGEDAGLALHREQIIPFSLDFDEWLQRGSGGAEARPLIEALLARAPVGTPCFRILVDETDTRRLHLQYHLSLWQRPAGA